MGTPAHSLASSVHSFAMARLAVTAALLLGALVSAAPADPVPVPTQFSITIPENPKTTIAGITFQADKGVVLMFTGIKLATSFDTTEKSITLTNGEFEAKVNHYVTRGDVQGLDISGDGTIDLDLGGNVINEISYTSTSADSFCAVAGSVKLAITTHTAKLDITGMKDSSVEQLFETFDSNQATLGGLVSNLIMTNYGDQINEKLV